MPGVLGLVYISAYTPINTYAYADTVLGLHIKTSTESRDRRNNTLVLHVLGPLALDVDIYISVAIAVSCSHPPVYLGSAPSYAVEENEYGRSALKTI
jgi:hypothetical protein